MESVKVHTVETVNVVPQGRERRWLTSMCLRTRHTSISFGLWNTLWRCCRSFFEKGSRRGRVIATAHKWNRHFNHVVACSDCSSCFPVSDYCLWLTPEGFEDVSLVALNQVRTDYAPQAARWTRRFAYLSVCSDRWSQFLEQQIERPPTCAW